MWVWVKWRKAKEWEKYFVVSIKNYYYFFTEINHDSNLKNDQISTPCIKSKNSLISTCFLQIDNDIIWVQVKREREKRKTRMNWEKNNRSNEYEIEEEEKTLKVQLINGSACQFQSR